VSITTATAGATIKYTTDGSTPSQTNGTVYGGAVAVATSLTLQAMAFKSGMSDSAVASAAYVISGATYSLSPAADAHVRDGSNAAVNYGTANPFEVKHQATTGNERNAYLRFTISSLPATINSAKIRLYGAAVTNAKALSIYADTVDSWTETGLTWNNAPAAGTKQSTVTVGLTSQYYDFDVTAFVKSERAAGNTDASFVLKADAAFGDSPTTFNSREAASNKPYMLVQ
jgi:hypothetical protein